MNKGSILVFTITYKGKEYCRPAFVENSLNLTYANRKHIIIDNSPEDDYYQLLKKDLQSTPIEVYRVERGNNSREALARAQNFARKYAKENGYDYLLSLESDIFPPYDFIERLMAHDVPVVTGLYLIGTPDMKFNIPCITLPVYHADINGWGTRLLKLEEHEEYIMKGLKQVQTGGFGCCLIKNEVWTRFVFYYDPRFESHSDVYFFNNCYDNKIDVFVDTDILCDHRRSSWLDVADR